MSEANDTDELITLHENNSCKKLIFLHPVIGSALPYIELSMSLTNTADCFAIQQAIKPTRPFHSISDMAKHYSAIILSNFIPQQVFLVGWSFGGLLAYEIAAYINKSSANYNNFIIMIDACFACPNQVDLYFKQHEFIDSEILSMLYKDITLNHLKKSPPIKINAIEDLVLALGEAGLMQNNETTLEYMATVFQSFKTNLSLMRGFKPKKSSTDIHHIISTETVNGITLDYNYWEKQTAGASSCQRLPGNHYSIMTKSHQLLVAAIKHAINSDDTITS